jgi:hypothetical protein
MRTRASTKISSQKGHVEGDKPRTARRPPIPTNSRKAAIPARHPRPVLKKTYFLSIGYYLMPP